MALTHPNASKVAATNAVTALFNQDVNGNTLRIYDDNAGAPGTELVSLEMSSTQPSFNDLPAFAAAAAGSGIATANPIANGVVEANGTAAHFILFDGVTEIMRGTVGTTGEDMNGNSVAFVIGQTISISSMTYRAVPV